MALVLNYLISFKKWYFYFIYLIGFWRKKCALRDKMCVCMCVCMSVFLCKVKNGNPFITSTTNFQLPSQLPYFPWRPGGGGRNHFVSGFLSLFTSRFLWTQLTSKHNKYKGYFIFDQTELILFYIHIMLFFSHDFLAVSISLSL